MIVLDGMPGAGKTTLLRRLTQEAPARVKVFSEAQPAHHYDDLEVARLLLKEAADRIHAARRLRTSQPDLVVASDRCHIGVLAYRYALAATGRSTHHAFDYTLAMCHTMGLTMPSSDVHTVVLIIDPQRSIARRTQYARDPRFALWFDPPFLGAYHDFLTRLNAWIMPHPQLTSIEAGDDLGWHQLAALLPQSLAAKLAALLTPPAQESR